MSAARRRPRDFDPARHERQLGALIDALAALPRLDARSLERVVKQHPRQGQGLFSRSEIIAGFRRLGGEARWKLEERELLARLRLRPVRTLSGVTPVTVLTKPYPCPGLCLFCPDDRRMPKSYLADEPGAQRAAQNDFDPYRQTWSRLATYREIGHPVEKVELIVLGGTWSAYPRPYQRWYLKRCFEALNDFGAALDGRDDGRAREGSEQASWAELEEAQRKNEVAGARCVGLSLETRPDWLDQQEALRIRRLGATKVQVGIQSVSDRVLELNRRGHDVAATRGALARLRRLGFKIQAHWMPNLHGSSPAQDAADFGRLFDDPGFRPDELKIYPCSLIESAELMGLYRRGEWRPYREEELLGLLTACLARTPEYCRLSRVIRDFSAGQIVSGSRTSNLREVAERRLREQGGRSREIRSREIRAGGFRTDALELRSSAYASSTGEERFLQFATPEDRLVAFLRLSLPAGPAPLAELEASALIRDLHVYGASLALGRRGGPEPQHLGLGRRLVEHAAEQAREAGFPSLAVISAVGTREYYRGLGFRDGPLYQHRSSRARHS